MMHLPPRHDRARPVPILAWLVLLMVVAAGLGTKGWLDRRYTRQAAAAVTPYVLPPLHQQVLARHETVVQAEAALGATLTPITTRGGSNWYAYIDPRAGEKYSLEFDSAGRLVGIAATRLPPSRLAWEEDILYRATTWLCPNLGGTFTPVFLLPGIALILWSRLAPAHRPWLNFAATALALVCATILVMPPNYTLTLKGLTSNDRLFWGVIGIAFAVGVLVYDRLHPVRDPLACASCGYDLRGNLTGVCPECGRPIGVHQAQ